MTDNSSPLTPLLYGVWIPRRGWIRAPDEKGIPSVFATDKLEIAKQLATRYGVGAKVYFVDDQLANMDAELIKQERLNSVSYRLSEWRRVTGENLTQVSKAMRGRLAVLGAIAVKAIRHIMRLPGTGVEYAVKAIGATVGRIRLWAFRRKLARNYTGSVKVIVEEGKSK